MRYLRAEGISWQAQTQRKGLVELLVDEEIMGSFLEFINRSNWKGETSKGERIEMGRKNRLLDEKVRISRN